MDALIVVDMQQDFYYNGQLKCYDTISLIPEVNKLIKKYDDLKFPIIFTQDWHTIEHCSFRVHGGLWPMHCLQNTFGSSLIGELNLPNFYTVARKGYIKNKESYSIFETPGFCEYLKNLGVYTLTVCGLATEYCVFSTVKDAILNGFIVTVYNDAIRPVISGTELEKEALEFFKQNIRFIEKEI
ncbi:MAG: isochorismatase family protein [Acidithiobacillus sp.]|jgi:nicotinamidase/pyrazinamidase|uniref:isochorismatase family protein n=1 Tax=Acidithiobacillus sp. TaxID=1872118 RepID=UPI0035602F24